MPLQPTPSSFGCWGLGRDDQSVGWKRRICSLRSKNPFASRLGEGGDRLPVAGLGKMPRFWLDEDQITLRTRGDVMTKKPDKPPCPHCDATDSTELLYRYRTIAKERWCCNCCSKTFDVKTC